MRPLALGLALIGAAALAWSYAGTVTARDGASSSTASLSGAAAHILIDEGGVMRPVANGGRVALRAGWATVRFDRVPIGPDSQVVVTVFDGSGAVIVSEVTAVYEALDMDHGRTVARSAIDGASHRMRLAFEMPGQWKVTVTVAREGSQETFTLVLPMAGL